MWYSATDGQYIQDGTQFIIDGVTYPPQWLNQATLSEKEAIGLEEVIATNSPANDQYYWVSTKLDKASLTYINTPKDLDQVKTFQITQVRATAYSILLPSDWMVVKAYETSTPINVEWNTWRASIRSVAEQTINTITNAQDVDAVATAMSEIVWPADPS